MPFNEMRKEEENGRKEVAGSKVTSSAYNERVFLSMFNSADYLCKLMAGKRSTHKREAK